MPYILQVMQSQALVFISVRYQTQLQSFTIQPVLIARIRKKNYNYQKILYFYLKSIQFLTNMQKLNLHKILKIIINNSKQNRLYGIAFFEY